MAGEMCASRSSVRHRQRPSQRPLHGIEESLYVWRWTKGGDHDAPSSSSIRGIRVRVSSRGVRPIRRSALGHKWRRSAEKAGVEGFTPHDLRHYAASVMIDQGTSIKACSTIWGTPRRVRRSTPTPICGPESEEVTRRALDAGLSAIASHPRHDAIAEG